MKDKYVQVKLFRGTSHQYPQEDSSLRSSIYSYIFQHVTTVTFLLLLTACSTSAPIETLPQTSVIPATDPDIRTQIIPTASATSSTPTMNPQVPFSRIILIEVGNVIWSTVHPFQSAVPLFKEENVIFGVTVWSHDGEWIAYAKATLDCPAVGSIWISRFDGSDARQITPSIETVINEETGDCSLVSSVFPASPAMFSSDDEELAVRFNGLQLTSLETGTSIRVFPEDAFDTEGIEFEFALDWLLWRGFSEAGNRALLTTVASENLAAPPILLWISLDDPDQATFLHPPPEFRFWYFRQSGPPIPHIWSADGRFLLIPDETESGDQSRLWRINVETDEWEIVRTQPSSFGYDELMHAAWSPDGQWAAWWSRSYEGRSKDFDFQILFLNISDWAIQRSVLAEDLKDGSILGWVTLSNGETRLVFSKGAPESEIVLLDPRNEAGDQLLITYGQLDFLFGDNWRRVGPFQP